VEPWRLPHERRFVILLALLSFCISGQTSSDPRISLYGHSEDATGIRFEHRNNYNAPVTFYQVRLQARCPDGTLAETGGWSFDTLRTRDGQPNLAEFAPIIQQQFVRWQTELDELKRWLESIRELRNAQDAAVTLKSLRDRLDQGYDDCEDRALTPQKLIHCQMNRQIRQPVNRLWQQLRSSELGADSTGRFISYRDRVADLLEQQSAPRN